MSFKLVGHTYRIPASMEEGFLHFVVLDVADTWGNVLCLCLETGETTDVRDWFFSDERRIL